MTIVKRKFNLHRKDSEVILMVEIIDKCIRELLQIFLKIWNGKIMKEDGGNLSRAWKLWIKSSENSRPKKKKKKKLPIWKIFCSLNGKFNIAYIAEEKISEDCIFNRKHLSWNTEGKVLKKWSDPEWSLRKCQVVKWSQVCIIAAPEGERNWEKTVTEIMAEYFPSSPEK